MTVFPAADRRRRSTACVRLFPVRADCVLELGPAEKDLAEVCPGEDGPSEVGAEAMLAEMGVGLVEADPS
jgi:hypothetical protein